MLFKSMKIATSMTVILFLFHSCQQKPADKDALAETDMSSNQIQNEKRVPVEALVIKAKKLEQKLPLTGVLKPIHSVDIIAEVSGKVKSINKKLGDTVSTKDTLAIIDDRIPLSQYRQAHSQVLSAENNLKIAQLNLKSDKELLENEDISQLAYENSLLAVKTAEASHLSALANFSFQEKQYQDTRIVSPIKGLISRKYIELGTMVTPNMPVYRVVDLSFLKIEVSIPQTLINRVQISSQAQIIISALNNQVFNGVVRYISPQADEKSGAFTAETHVKNSSDLKIRAGMTAKIDLHITGSEKRLVVPEYALVSRDDKKYVYKIEKKTARLTPISINESYGSQIPVDKGLAEGDSIVIVGMKNLGVETKVNIESIQ